MKLSKNFTLDECTFSATAENLGIENDPTNEQIENIKALVENILQPIRDYFGVPVTINSVFRCKELNEAVKGSGNSQHLCNNNSAAADIYVNAIKMQKVFDYIKDHLDYDQLINEKNLSWIHVSYRRDGKNRKQSFAIK